MGASLRNWIKEVSCNPILIHKVNNTFISLIPKAEKPDNPIQFRPIVLCDVLYKLITKIGF